MSDLPTGNGSDWPAQAADTIVRVVGQVRDKTTGPALTVARGLVYGLLAAAAGIVALVMVAIVAVRLLDVYLPERLTGDDNTWLAHGIVGLLFTIAGIVAWSQRRPRAEEH